MANDKNGTLYGESLTLESLGGSNENQAYTKAAKALLAIMPVFGARG